MKTNTYTHMQQRVKCVKTTTTTKSSSLVLNVELEKETTKFQYAVIIAAYGNTHLFRN